MDKLFKPEIWHAYWADFVHWLTEQVLVPATLVQFILLIVLFWLSGFAAHPIKRRLQKIRTHEGFDRIVEEGTPLARPLAWLVLQWLAVIVAVATGGEHYILEVTATLITAWVLIRKQNRGQLGQRKRFRSKTYVLRARVNIPLPPNLATCH